MTATVLAALAARTQGATVEELANDTSHGVERVRDALAELVARGLAEADPNFGGRFRLGPAAAALGVAGRNVRMRLVALPRMQALHEQAGLNVSLHVIEGDYHRVIEEAPRPAPDRPLPSYSRPVALRVGATAKVLLAHLPPEEADAILARTGVVLDPANSMFTDLAAWRAAAPTRAELGAIRAAGFAISGGTRNRGVGGRALTAPVFEWGGRICAGLCVFGPMDDERAHALAPTAVETAAKLSRELRNLRG